MPRNIFMSAASTPLTAGPWQGQPNGVHDSVGAILGSNAAGGLNIVSRIPSG
jgi:hypothetical protein